MKCKIEIKDENKEAIEAALAAVEMVSVERKILGRTGQGGQA